MFTKGHRLQESWNLCCCSAVKLNEATEMFMMVDYVREMTVKKTCSYGEYGFLSICSSC